MGGWDGEESEKIGLYVGELATQLVDFWAWNWVLIGGICKENSYFPDKSWKQGEGSDMMWSQQRNDNISIPF